MLTAHGNLAARIGTTEQGLADLLSGLCIAGEEPAEKRKRIADGYPVAVAAIFAPAAPSATSAWPSSGGDSAVPQILLNQQQAMIKSNGHDALIHVSGFLAFLDAALADCIFSSATGTRRAMSSSASTSSRSRAGHGR